MHAPPIPSWSLGRNGQASHRARQFSPNNWQTKSVYLLSRQSAFTSIYNFKFSVLQMATTCTCYKGHERLRMLGLSLNKYIQNRAKRTKNTADSWYHPITMRITNCHKNHKDPLSMERRPILQRSYFKNCMQTKMCTIGKYLTMNFTVQKRIIPITKLANRTTSLTNIFCGQQDDKLRTWDAHYMIC